MTKFFRFDRISRFSILCFALMEKFREINSYVYVYKVNYNVLQCFNETFHKWRQKNLPRRVHIQILYSSSCFPVDFSAFTLYGDCIYFRLDLLSSMIFRPDSFCRQNNRGSLHWKQSLILRTILKVSKVKFLSIFGLNIFFWNTNH